MAFQDGDHIRVVSNSKSYSGRHSCKTGIVEGYQPSYDTVSVKLDNVDNPETKYERFYFKPEELQKLKKGTKQMLNLNLTTVENTKNENVTILDLWYQNGVEFFSASMRKEKRDALENSKQMSELKKLAITIAELKYPELTGIDREIKEEKLLGKIMEDGVYPDELMKQLCNIGEKYENSLKNLAKLKTEIYVMCQACENYEQQMAVLKAYRVVNEDGTLNGDSDGM